MAVQTEVAHSLGLTTWGLSEATDSKTVDTQTRAEAAFDSLFQALEVIDQVGRLETI
jgi:hypothetical protein